MNVWKSLSRVMMLTVLAFVVSGCSFFDNLARRKIPIYDFNQRSVIAVLDHVSPEYSTREIYELNPDFGRKTFVTYQSFADNTRIKIRRYTFDGVQVEEWDVPTWFYRTQSFSTRENWLVYQKDEVLMVRDLSDLSKPSRQLSPTIKGFKLAWGSVEPSFVWLTDKTLLCLMRPEGSREGGQLWKLSLEGDGELLRSDIDSTWPHRVLSSDFAGTHHAVIASNQRVLFLDNHAQPIGQLETPFEIHVCGWDDHACFWVHNYDGDYLCYDVERKTIVHSGCIPKEKNVYNSSFFQGQYYVQHKRLFLGFYRRTVRDLSGTYIETLPSETSSLLHLGNGRFLVEED